MTLDSISKSEPAKGRLMSQDFQEFAGSLSDRHAGQVHHRRLPAQTGQALLKGVFYMAAGKSGRLQSRKKAPWTQNARRLSTNQLP